MRSIGSCFTTTGALAHMDEFSCERILTMETEALLIATLHWMGTGDVNPFVAFSAVKHVVNGAQDFHWHMHGKSRLE